MKGHERGAVLGHASSAFYWTDLTFGSLDHQFREKNAICEVTSMQYVNFHQFE